MIPEFDSEVLLNRRRQVIGRLFVRAARVFQEQAIQGIHALGYTDYRLGDNLVLVHLETGGNRISELAKRAGVTKQAISQLVRDLEKRGIVKKNPDPTDGRAQLVTLTEQGLKMMLDAFEVVSELDKTFAAVLPEGRLETMRMDLITLLEAMEPDGF